LIGDGELAINTLDEKLYFKNSAGTVKLLASAAGSAGELFPDVPPETDKRKPPAPPPPPRS
jgi:hypothetical protein